MGSCPLQFGEGYHASRWRSLTDFTLLRATGGMSPAGTKCESRNVGSSAAFEGSAVSRLDPVTDANMISLYP